MLICNMIGYQLGPQSLIGETMTVIFFENQRSIDFFTFIIYLIHLNNLKLELYIT